MSVVFPAPAGAEIHVARIPARVAIWANNRSRVTHGGNAGSFAESRSAGTLFFDDTPCRGRVGNAFPCSSSYGRSDEGESVVIYVSLPWNLA